MAAKEIKQDTLRKIGDEVILNTGYVFTRKRHTIDRFVRAHGLCFMYKNPSPESGQVDFKEEARQLATYLYLAFPVKTMEELRKLIPERK